jgi:hypothetical protein
LTHLARIAGVVLLLAAAVYWMFLAPSRPARAQVYLTEGRVLHQGQPVAGAELVFVPEDECKNLYRPQAKTDANGAFKLTTYSANDGAPAGRYKVRLTCLPENPESFVPEVNQGPRGKLPTQTAPRVVTYQDTNKDRFANRYSDPNSSGLSAEVKTDGANNLTIHLD